MPSGVSIVGGSLFDASYGNPRIQCILAYTDGAGASIFVRQGWMGLTGTKWDRLVKEPEYKALVNRVATLEAKLNELDVMQTRVQALETRIKSLETNQ